MAHVMVDDYVISKTLEFLTSREKLTAQELFTLYRDDTTRPFFDMLRDVTYDWLRHYDGTFEFVMNMKRQYLMTDQLSLKQAAGVINCMRADMVYKARKNSLELAITPEAPVTSVAKTITAQSTIMEGIYTIGTDEQGSDHVTIRIVPHWDEDEAAKGIQVAKYLCGPDNGTMYSGFAFVNGTRIIIWKRFRDNERIVNALQGLMAGSEEERREMGYAYAAQSNRCWKCGKPLTVPASQMAGLGPICYAKVYGG
jgi:hypothetical protein